MSPKAKSVFILGSRLDEVGWKEIDLFCTEALSGNTYRYIVTINGEIALKAEKNMRLQQAINEADLVIPDTTNIVWAGRKRGLKLDNPTPGADLIFHFCEIAQSLDKSIFLLGSKEGVAKKAGERLQKMYPGLMLAGISSANPDNLQVVEEIKRLKPDILVVAYGAPKQEIWMQTHRNLPCKLVAGLGGTLDMVSGNLPRAPRWLRAIHMEWLWRLILQPSRIGRIWQSLVVFPLKTLL